MSEIELDPEQRRAVDLIFHSPISVITGGPGTGKTHCTKTALDALDAAGKTYTLCAPTGKAARRLSEMTGRSASTIHRMLGFNPISGFTYNIDNKLYTDLIIVDESSMIDIALASDLLEAVDHDETRIAFVGDADQLPPVGPGAFFRDLIASETVPTVRLKTLHRAAQESWVCRNAPQVLRGKPIEMEDFDDFQHMEVDDANDLDDAVIELMQSLADDGENLEEIQVLTPRKDVAGGTNHLNAAMQKYFNPQGQMVIKHPWQQLRIGDRVIQTKNNYRIGVFNGEVGTIPGFVGAGVVVQYEKIEKVKGDYQHNYFRYTIKEAEQLLLAYAITVHRSQGSEWPIVVVVCHSDHSNMLTRQLLYTAITRTKRRLFIVGDKPGLQRALRTDKDTRRRTMLVPRIQQAV